MSPMDVAEMTLHRRRSLPGAVTDGAKLRSHDGSMISANRQPHTASIRRCVWLSFAVAVTWLPVPTRAQDFDPRADAAAHIGPLYVAPTLLLEDFGYDSNV